jgi:hypothetical protein
MRMPSLSARLALLCASLFPGAGYAAIYALSTNDAGTAQTVRNISTGATTATSVANCCAIAAGTVTIDATSHRAYFIKESAAGSFVVVFNYVNNATSQVALSSGYRVTHMEIDAPNARLLALARDLTTDQIVMAEINPVTGVLGVRAALAAPCCRFKIGVSALTRNAGLRLFVVGTNATAAEQLLVFDFDANTGPQAVNIPNGLQLNDLVVHPITGTLLGLAHDPTALVALPISVGAAPGYAISTIGAGTVNCCFALAGPAAIDRGSNRIFTLGSVYGASAPVVLSFDLATGTPSTGIALSGSALFEDFGVVAEALFADGFE